MRQFRQYVLEHCGELPYGSAKVTIDQTLADSMSPNKVKVEDPFGVITAIRERSHRVLAKKTDDGVCTYCKLRDDNSNFFFDNTAATLTGSMGDVMLKIDCDIYYRSETTATDTIVYYISLRPAAGYYKMWWSNWMLGVFEACKSGNYIYSRAGESVANNITQGDFQTYATNRGTGYTQVVWQMHCMMALLYYALYKNTNSQGSIGYGDTVRDGTAAYKATGQTAVLGMIDTVGENGILLPLYQKGATDQGNAMSINFWGLENWWGNYLEWFGDAKALTAGSANLTVWIPDPTTGLLSSSCATRVIPVSAIMKQNSSTSWSSSFVKKMRFGQYGDLVNATRTIDGTDATQDTYYCDTQAMTDLNDSTWAGNGTRVVRRSNNLAYPAGGVASANASYAPSLTVTNGGARLAFSGQSVEAASVAAFLAL